MATEGCSLVLFVFVFFYANVEGEMTHRWGEALCCLRVITVAYSI